MSWRPVQNIVYAVCVRRFEPTQRDEVSLDIGDDVYITEIGGTNDAWCRGWLLQQSSVLAGLATDNGQGLIPRAQAGTFPRICVQVREALTEDGDKIGLKNGLSDYTQAVGGAPRVGDAPVQTLVTDGGMRDALLTPIDVQPRAPDDPKEEAPLPALRIGDATPFSSDEPLVDEISSCLREWQSTNVHQLLLNREYDLLDKLSDLAERLDLARKQLIHNLLTEKELTTLRERTVWDLVHGNKLLNGEVIVRSPNDKGRILTAEDSIPGMLELQALMSLRTKPLLPPVDDAYISHLMVEVKQTAARTVEPGILHMYLCRQSGDLEPRPVSETFAIEVPFDGQAAETLSCNQLPRTLFTDLTKAEVGSATDPSSHLYLVCLLYREEAPRKKFVAAPSPSIPQTDRMESLSRPENHGSRRSFLWGSQRGRKLLDNNTFQDPSRPTTRESSRSKARGRPPTPPSTDAQTRPASSGKKLRRLVGYSAVEIGELVRHHDHDVKQMSFWAPMEALEEIVDEPQVGQEGWENVIKSLVRNPMGTFTKVASSESFQLDLRAFAHSNADLLIKDNPALLREVYCTQALNLSSDPAHQRSDVYLTLKEPLLPFGARCFHPQDGSVDISGEADFRNLQLTLEVRTESGKRIESAIWPTSNRPPHTAFRTPAIDRGETWDQTIRVSVANEDLPQAHIVLSIAEGNHFPFALAWVPLWDHEGSVCTHGHQTLALWDYSEYTASTINGRGAYQMLPSRLDQIPNQEPNTMAALLVEVTLSSSTTPQDPTISSLLQWDGTTVEGLMPLLGGFKRAPDAEIVKFYKPILAALDRIFDVFYRVVDDTGTGVNIGEDFTERALSCLVHTLHLTRDRRFSSTKGLFEEYIQERHHSTDASKSVCRAFRSVISRPYEIEDARELRRTLQVSAQVIRFITHQNHSGSPKSKASIMNAVSSVLVALVNLMRNPREDLYGTQTILMQQFSSWLLELMPVLASDELLDLVEGMMHASVSKKGALRMHRLVMVKEISEQGTFNNDEDLPRLHDLTKDWLEDYWPEAGAITEQKTESVRMCCSVLRTQQARISAQSMHYTWRLFEAYHMMAELWDNKVDGPTRPQTSSKSKKTLSSLFPRSYPFSSVAVDTFDVPNEALMEITAVLDSFFQNGPPQGQLFVDGKNSESKTMQEILMLRAFKVLRSVNKGEAFPPHWLSLHVTHAKTAVSILEWLLDILVQNFVPSEDDSGVSDVMEFNSDFWELWFQIIIDLSLGKVVSMETFTEQTRRAIWTIGGDIRADAALLLQRGWAALGWKAPPEYIRVLYPMDRVGGYQVGLSTNVIPSVVRLCMGLHDQLQAVGLDVLRSVIVSEWQLNESLAVVQAAIIATFDSMNRDDEPVQSPFASAFLERLAKYFAILEDTSLNPLYDSVMQMIAEVERLFMVLADLGDVKDPASRMVQLLRLMEFLRLSGQEEAYLARIHELAQLHVNARNYSSAACAIDLHVRVLNETKASEMLEPIRMPGLETPAEMVHARRDRLYQTMATYYEKGLCWEDALQTLKRLSEAREAAWDAAGLAQVRADEARIYNLLAAGPVQLPRHFYVAFNDHELFPDFVRGKQFIFESPTNCDRRGFAESLQVQYPYVANLSPEYTNPTSSSQDPTIKITPVTVFKNHSHPVNQRGGIAPGYREHCLTSRPSAFAMTSRHDNPQISVAEQVVEKTVFYTEMVFPTIVSYSAIIREEKVVLTAVQAAIDRTQRKTLNLALATESANSKGESYTDTLIDAIVGVVDTSTGSSVSEYHRLLESFTRPTTSSTTNGTIATENHSLFYGSENSMPKTKEMQLQEALVIALEDHVRCIEDAISFPYIKSYVKNELRDGLEDAFLLELHALYPARDWRIRSPAWQHTEVSRAPGSIQQSIRSEVFSTDMEYSHTLTERPRGRRASIKKRLSFLNLGTRSASRAASRAVSRATSRASSRGRN